jgi:biopolymer transport protein ExbD
MIKPLLGRKKTTLKKPLNLPLTSLIDAFSIIVFYLLVTTQTAGIDQNLPQDLELPKISELELILQDDPIVLKVNPKGYFIGEESILVNHLARSLAEKVASRKKAGLPIALLIQADQKQAFEKLNPILEAASQAQITELKFAVLPDMTIAKGPRSASKQEQGN